MDTINITHDSNILNFSGSLKLDKILGVALVVRKYNKGRWISSVIYDRIKEAKNSLEEAHS